MHSLNFNLSILITMGGKVKELQLFRHLTLFQGTISIWTVYSKAISWTDVDYSFVIIPSKELSVQLKQTIVRHQKQNKSIREIAETFGVAKSKEQFGKF